MWVVNLGDAGPEAVVWGTQGVSYCPEEGFATLDPEAIAEEAGALAAVINGPRHWLVNNTTGGSLDGDRALVMVVDGEATVLTDDLTNTYQRMADPTAGQRGRNGLRGDGG